MSLTPEVAEARTQKARGLQVIANVANTMRNALHAFTLPFTLLDSDDGVMAFAETFERARERAIRIGDTPLSYFARPCPITPQHGFVNSRVVKTGAALLNVWLETRAADPEGELVVMRPINAPSSAIVTRSGITIGPGHAGATAANAGPATWALPFVNPLDLPAKTLADARCTGDKQTWFAEIVAEHPRAAWDMSGRYLVQLRAGDASAAALQTRIFPTAIHTVLGVFDGTHLAPEDTPFLDIQRAVAELVENGYALYMPGIPSSCHVIVQATTAGVPVFCGDAPAPVVGEMYVGGTPPIDPAIGLAAFARGLAFGLADDFSDGWASAVRALCTALHHHATWSRSSSGQTALGIAVAYMLRFGTAAGWGESRHAKHMKHGVKGESRHQIYDVALTPGAYNLRASLPTLLNTFATRAWHHGYGGPAWAQCTAALAALDLAVADAIRATYRTVACTPKQPKTLKALATDPTYQQHCLDAIGAALNRCVNCAHNGGWWLNKFASESAMNTAAACVPRTVIDDVFFLHAATLAPMSDAERLATLAPFFSRTHEKKAYRDQVTAIITDTYVWPYPNKKMLAKQAKGNAFAKALAPSPSKGSTLMYPKVEVSEADGKLTGAVLAIQAYPAKHFTGPKFNVVWHCQVAFVDDATGAPAYTSHALYAHDPTPEHTHTAALAIAAGALSASFASGSNSLYVPLEVDDGETLHTTIDGVTFAFSCPAHWRFSTDANGTLHFRASRFTTDMQLAEMAHYANAKPKPLVVDSEDN